MQSSAKICNRDKLIVAFQLEVLQSLNLQGQLRGELRRKGT